MLSLGKIIEKRLNQHKLGDSARASQVINLANNFLEEHFKNCSDDLRALTLKDGVLKIGSRSSVLSQELWHHQEVLLQKIRSSYGVKVVNKILITSLAESLENRSL